MDIIAVQKVINFCDKMNDFVESEEIDHQNWEDFCINNFWDDCIQDEILAVLADLINPQGLANLEDLC